MFGKNKIKNDRHYNNIVNILQCTVEGRSAITIRRPDCSVYCKRVYNIAAAVAESNPALNIIVSRK